MTKKTTSGSGFHFIVVFSAPDVVENAINLEKFSHFFEIFGSEFTKFKNYANELHELGTKNFNCHCVVIK